jgi:hypothetical protein
MNNPNIKIENGVLMVRDSPEDIWIDLGFNKKIFLKDGCVNCSELVSCLKDDNRNFHCELFLTSPPPFFK